MTLSPRTCRAEVGIRFSSSNPGVSCFAFAYALPFTAAWVLTLPAFMPAVEVKNFFRSFPSQIVVVIVPKKAMRAMEILRTPLGNAWLFTRLDLCST